jgi:hypothetical protein
VSPLFVCHSVTALIIPLALALSTGTAAAAGQPSRASLGASQHRRVASAKDVRDFVEWSRQGERRIVDVWKRAVEVFPRGWSIEGYPQSVGDPASKRSAQALHMVSAQLERDGIKPESVEAVTLFFGDDGVIQRDVVLVVRKAQRTIVGIYQAWHGR